MPLRSFALLGLLLLGARLEAAPKIPEKYDRWLNEEVTYIVTDDERRTFLTLKTDPERDKFIEEFWQVRNPLRGSKDNPYKEEHYRRLEYANQYFGRETNTPGWKTDMGRTWILFGKPQSRAPFKGHGQIYPLELWFYPNNTGSASLPSFFYVLFFIPEDIGDYRFYRPTLDGPMKLVRGSQFNSNRDVYRFLKPLGGDLAHAILSLNPSEPIDTETFKPSIGSEMLVSKIQDFANDSYNVKRIREMRFLRERVKSWFLVQQQQPLEIESIALADPAGNYWLDYGVLVADEKLGRPDPSGAQLVVNVGFRLLTEKDELIVEDTEERSYPAFDNSSGTRTFQPFLIANRVPVIPGTYKLEVELVNREAARSYKGEKKIEVPAHAKPSFTGPLLSASVEQVQKPDPNTPFQYFGVQFKPAAERRLLRRDPLRLLFQVRTPESRDYQVEYVVAHLQNREARETLTEELPAAGFQNGALLKAKTIPLKDFESGDYRVIVNLKTPGSAEVLASSILPLKLVDERVDPPLYFLNNFRSVASGAAAPYIRALEALAFKNEDTAASFLQQSIDRDPANAFANRLLVQLYFNSRKFDRVTALFDQRGMAPFQGAPDSLAQIALSYWQSGNAEAARRIIHSAKANFPKNAFLLSLDRRFSQ